MYAGMVGGSVSKIPLSSVGEDSNASGNVLTSARRFSVGKMNPGTATGNWRGRRQSAFHGVSFNAKVFDPKEQRVEVRFDEERRTAGAKRQQHIVNPHN